jgi:transcription elongation factor GreA-like protein
MSSPRAWQAAVDVDVVDEVVEVYICSSCPHSPCNSLVESLADSQSVYEKHELFHFYCALRKIYSHIAKN